MLSYTTLRVLDSLGSRFEAESVTLPAVGVLALGLLVYIIYTVRYRFEAPI